MGANEKAAATYHGGEVAPDALRGAFDSLYRMHGSAVFAGTAFPVTVVAWSSVCDWRRAVLEPLVAQHRDAELERLRAHHESYTDAANERDAAQDRIDRALAVLDVGVESGFRHLRVIEARAILTGTDT